MSTRCQVLVEGHDVAVYRHSDGYPHGPSGVLHDLLPILGKFVSARGWDSEYMTAHIVGEFVRKHRQHCQKRRRKLAADGRALGRVDYEGEFIGLGLSQFTGSFHGDEEFIYVVRPSRPKKGLEVYVEVRVPKGDFWDSPTLENTKLLHRARLDGTPYRGKADKYPWQLKNTKGPTDPVVAERHLDLSGQPQENRS